MRPDPKAIRRLLPWRVRFRLRVNRCVDRAGIWLVEHQHIGAAKRLWRIEALTERRAGFTSRARAAMMDATSLRRAS